MGMTCSSINTTQLVYKQFNSLKFVILCWTFVGFVCIIFNHDLPLPKSRGASATATATATTTTTTTTTTLTTPIGSAPTIVFTPPTQTIPHLNHSSFISEPQIQRANISQFNSRLYPKNAQGCQGRTKIQNSRGYITDGHGNYSINTQCQWLIHSGLPNATIRIRLLEFDTECNFDYLYIFDGDSMFAPLVASLSGPITSYYDRKVDHYSDPNSAGLYSKNEHSSVEYMNELLWTSKTPEIVTTSGSAFVYFHSDTAQSMPGFNLSYSINSCPLDCSDRGDCDILTLQCKCAPGFFGYACQFTECPGNCSSSTGAGQCDQKSRLCKCSLGYSGNDCSIKASVEDQPETNANKDLWTIIDHQQNNDIGRAFHQAIAVGDMMWVIGGKLAYSTIPHDNSVRNVSRQTRTSPITSFNFQTEKWTYVDNPEILNYDPLIDLFGHSVVQYKQSLYIYGGMTSNMIVNLLVRFDTSTFHLDILKSITQDTENKSSIFDDEFNAPVAVFGHSANVFEQFMYVFFGYNPTLGYLDWVQKYDFDRNSWSLVKTSGSSVEGCVGHTTTYDPISGLIFLVGGHHYARTGSFYAFDPRNEHWTYLQPAPTSRFYHRSIIVDGSLVVVGGNSYNATTSFTTEDCLDSQMLVFDLSCVTTSYKTPVQRWSASPSSSTLDSHRRPKGSRSYACNMNACWRTIATAPDNVHVLRRYGHSLVVSAERKHIYLYGGFNGFILKSIYKLKLQDCADFNENRRVCEQTKLTVSCSWSDTEQKCQQYKPRWRSWASIVPSNESTNTDSQASSSIDLNWNANQIDSECTIFGDDLVRVQRLCESRQTCTDCLSTSFGCRWCQSGHCKYEKCPTNAGSSTLHLSDSEQCYMRSAFDDRTQTNNISGSGANHTFQQDNAAEIECRRVTDCYMCQTKSQCFWQNECVPRRLSSINLNELITPLPQPMPSTAALTSSSLSTAPLNPSSTSLSTPSVASTNSNLVEELSLLPVSSPNTNVTLRVKTKNGTEKAIKTTLFTSDLLSALTPLLVSHSDTCDLPCYRRQSCKDCVVNKCIWCSSTNECIDSSAYLTYYPIGQCMHYVAHHAKCHGTVCSELETCEQCLKNPKCGWLDDGTLRGTGNCMDGSNIGPLRVNNPSTTQDQHATVASSSASTSVSTFKNWYFDGCPLCQCNGHSTCRPGSNICIKPCANHTEGSHCERCQSGYYGNPINGGTCHECNCHSHATSCNRDTGKCYCSTKGILGNNCNKCDEQNHYLGDSSNLINGTCYYNLTTDFQYTFNMSKPEDFNYSDINFMSIPARRDADVDFTISCSGLALVNISSGLAYRFGPSHRTTLYSNVECGSFKIKFPYEQLLAGTRNFTFYVNVFGFQTPFVLQISFSQHRNIDLWQFFFTFSSCFLFLTIVVGIIWKLRQRYSLYRRRQQQFVEMEQMASRPFVTVLLDLTPGKKTELLTSMANKFERSGDHGKLHKMDEIVDGQPSHQGKSTVSATNADDHSPNDEFTAETQFSHNSKPTTQRSAKFPAVNYHRVDSEAPTPIAIEPCASGQAGVVSLLVQLPGRPSLAIASALVSLNQQQQNNDSKDAGQRANDIKQV